MLEEPVGANEPIPNRGRWHRWRWPLIGIAAVAVISVLATVFASGDNRNLREEPLTSEDWVAIAGAPSTAAPETEIWRYPDMLASIGQEHCQNVAPPPSDSEQEVLHVWAWQDASFLTSSLLVDPSAPFGVWIVYQNQTKKQTDDVAVWLELPEGFELVENSTYWSTASDKNGNFTTGSLEYPGINLGSYGTSANFAVGTQIHVIYAEQACGETQVIKVHSQSREGRDNGADSESDSVHISCT